MWIRRSPKNTKNSRPTIRRRCCRKTTRRRSEKCRATRTRSSFSKSLPALRSYRRDEPGFQNFQAVQPLRSVQSPTSFLPRVAGEDEGRGLNDFNCLKGFNSECEVGIAHEK